MSAIQTDFIYPPIPVRQFDWAAFRDPEGQHGFGLSEDDAILDLLETEALRDDSDEPYECDCGCRYAEAVSVLVCRENDHGAE